MSIVNLYSNPEALKLNLQLVRVALKAHLVNPSPVDIKQEMAAMNVEMLMQMEEDLQKVLEPYQPVKQQPCTDKCQA